MTNLKEAFSSFNPAEAFGLAVRIEKDGFALYQKAIDRTENERAKDDLKFLRDQEAGHQAVYEKLLKATGKEYVENADSPLYAWVKENMIQPVQAALEKEPPQNYKEALLIGLALEDKSIEFYKMLKKKSESKDDKKAITGIIREEKRHKNFLNAVMRYSLP